MSGMKQHGQDVRQNHEKSVAHIGVAVGWLSKTAQTDHCGAGSTLLLRNACHTATAGGGYFQLM